MTHQPFFKKSYLLLMILSLITFISCTTNRTGYSSYVKIKDQSGNIVDEGIYVYETDVEVSKALSTSCKFTFWAIGGSCWGYKLLPTDDQEEKIKNKAEFVLNQKFGKDKWEADSVYFYDAEKSGDSIKKGEYISLGTKEEKRKQELLAEEEQRKKLAIEESEKNEKRERTVKECNGGSLGSCFSVGLIFKDQGNKAEAFKYLNKACGGDVSYCFRASSQMQLAGIEDSKIRPLIQRACTYSKEQNIRYKQNIVQPSGNGLIIQSPLANPCFVAENWNKSLQSCECDIIIRTTKLETEVEILSIPNEEQGRLLIRAANSLNDYCKSTVRFNSYTKNKCRKCKSVGIIKDLIKDIPKWYGL